MKNVTAVRRAEWMRGVAKCVDATVRRSDDDTTHIDADVLPLRCRSAIDARRETGWP